jgi:hypothetical protein
VVASEEEEVIRCAEESEESDEKGEGEKDC